MGEQGQRQYKDMFGVIGIDVAHGMPETKMQNGKALAEKCCDLERKLKETHKESHAILEGNLTCWREIWQIFPGLSPLVCRAIFTYEAYGVHLERL